LRVPRRNSCAPARNSNIPLWASLRSSQNPSRNSLLRTQRTRPTSVWYKSYTRAKIKIIPVLSDYVWDWPCWSMESGIPWSPGRNSLLRSRKVESTLLSRLVIADSWFGSMKLAENLRMVGARSNQFRGWFLCYQRNQRQEPNGS
jgi:hypothetical protein